MITAEARKEAFLYKLRILLEAAGATLDVSDDGKDYGMQSGVCNIDMAAVYDDDGNTEKEYVNFNLPMYMP